MAASMAIVPPAVDNDAFTGTDTAGAWMSRGAVACVECTVLAVI